MALKDFQTMDQMVMPKAIILTQLKKNRKLHKKIYDAAVLEYNEELLCKLEEELDKVKAKETPDLVFPNEPEHHLKDYDRAISMLEMTKKPDILMTSHDYDQYVMDEWNWKYNWSNTTAVYASNVGMKKKK